MPQRHRDAEEIKTGVNGEEVKREKEQDEQPSILPFNLLTIFPFNLFISSPCLCASVAKFLCFELGEAIKDARQLQDVGERRDAHNR